MVRAVPSWLPGLFSWVTSLLLCSSPFSRTLSHQDFPSQGLKPPQALYIVLMKNISKPVGSKAFLCPGQPRLRPGSCPQPSPSGTLFVVSLFVERIVPVCVLVLSFGLILLLSVPHPTTARGELSVIVPTRLRGPTHKSPWYGEMNFQSHPALGSF